MTPKLIEPGESGNPPREILLSKEEFLIGRGPDCDLSILSSDVSRHHCLIRVRGRQATIDDLGSSNGTFVNGQRIRAQTTLRTSDRIEVGETKFIVDLGDTIEFKLNDQDQAAITVRKMRPPAPGHD